MEQPDAITESKVQVIAEAGVNHNGSLETALELVNQAADAGADFVKFQTFNSTELATKGVEKAAYQIAASDESESQLEMLQRLELSHHAHHVLWNHCKDREITFLSTAFDLDSLNFLATGLGLRTLKLGSGELTNGPLLLAAARSGMNLLLSSGMGSLAEVEEALGVVAFGLLGLGDPSGRDAFAEALLDPLSWNLLRSRVSVLHCTTEYPAAHEDTNLRAIDTMRQAFGLRVGYSDHTQGGSMSLAAVARGAQLIEKHFTLDRNMDGPDHRSSLEPKELAALIDDIRAVEVGLGSGIKQPGRAEVKNRSIARKCVVAARHIPANKVIDGQDLTTMRAKGAITGMAFWDCIGMRTKREFPKDTPLDWGSLHG